MGVLTDRFPDDIAYGAEGGWAGWLVTIITHAGGQETAHLDDPYARGRWNVARAIEELNLHEAARRHFVKARASYHHFRFKDWSDYQVDRTGDDRGVLTGSGTSWQIGKSYGADDATYKYVRPINRIVDDSESIWKNGVLQVQNTDYTIDNDTGIVTSLSSWTGATLEVSCEFDVLCRYDVDRLAATMPTRHAAGELMIQWQDIDIVEVRED